MEIKDKTKIKINLNSLYEKVKKEFKNDYFKLTFFYMAVYAVMSMILVHGVNFLSEGDLKFGDLRSEVVVITITLMMTMATMAKRLKDDIVSNYWKLVKSNRRKKPRKS
jgi:uncharacterized membrane protein YhaH (DUF805 family)